MRLSALGVGVAGLVVPALFALGACGRTAGSEFPDGGSSGSSSGAGSGGSSGSGGGDGGCVFGCSSGSGSGGGYDGGPRTFLDADVPAPDCPAAGCPPFPGMSAPMCASGTPAIQVVYPNDGVLVPPNMDVMSVQWTPFGAPFTEFEVDFENAATDLRVPATCATQTMDTEQPPQPSGGCELVLTPAMWQAVANQNRGGDAVTVTVRGTTDGMCASPSANSVRVAFAQEDLHGAIYYWKSTVSAAGTGGQIWEKTFGDLTPEQDITTPLALASCTGCHALSRDGLRMVINNDDNDSDDEYSDVMASLVDYTMGLQAGVVVGGTGLGRVPGLMKPSFATFSPDHSQFLITNGLGSANGATNVLFLYDGNTDMMTSTIMNLGSATQMATMPDWSADGKSVLFVIPQKAGSWAGKIFGGGGGHNDDDHIFGGSLYTMPYTGNGQFGAPAPFLVSGGENNYYPSYSPDGQLVDLRSGRCARPRPPSTAAR